jgi:hypothetical protein
VQVKELLVRAAGAKRQPGTSSESWKTRSRSSIEAITHKNKTGGAGAPLAKARI